MLHIYRRLAASTAVLAVTALAGIAIAGPASAAPAPAPAAPVAAAPVPLATFGTQSSAVGAGSPGATTQGIDWGNVVRTLNSMVECEMLIPLYEVLYFPSSIVCLPYTGGTAVMVIVRWW